MIAFAAKAILTGGIIAAACGPTGSFVNYVNPQPGTASNCRTTNGETIYRYHDSCKTARRCGSNVVKIVIEDGIIKSWSGGC